MPEQPCDRLLRQADFLPADPEIIEIVRLEPPHAASVGYEIGGMETSHKNFDEERSFFLTAQKISGRTPTRKKSRRVVEIKRPVVNSGSI